MLQAGSAARRRAGARLTSDAAGEPIPLAYFWLTGVLSSFLDNAPTYLVFFDLAGGDAEHLTGPVRRSWRRSRRCGVLGRATAISATRRISCSRRSSRSRGVRMPGFFGYMLLWATLLCPAFSS